MPSIRVEGPDATNASDEASPTALPDSFGEETASFLKGTVGALTALVSVSWVFLAVYHADDRFDVGWTQGTWMGLAQSARRGILYPPLYDGSRYGGTRFMPIPILLLAQLARVTGEYLVSGKLFSYLSFGLLLGVIVAVLRSIRCPLYVALGLAAAVLVSETGLFVASGIGADALPVALQLVAVTMVARSRSWPATLAAAGLCALAFFTKESALWAPIAICIWLLMKDRRRLVAFLPAFVVLCAVMAVLFGLLTHGRFFSNVAGLSFSGVSNTTSPIRPLTIFPMILSHAAPASLLLPIAIVGWALAARHGELTIYHVSLASAVALLLVVLTDVGADFNHLLDLIVLVSIVVGLMWPRSGLKDRHMSLLGGAILVVLSWALLSSFVAVMFLPQGGVLDALNGRRAARFDRRPLAGYVTHDDVILSEDPTIPIELGQRPVVLDAFMLLRIGEKHPGWLRDLIERIRGKEFTRVLLTRPLIPDDRSWYETFHFGPAVFDALRSNYVEAAHAQGYYVYVAKV